MTREWHTTDKAPLNEVVETKIDDENGERNHSLLRRQGRLWFVPNGSMYVYYRPTHWRRLTSEQLENLAKEAEREAQEHLNRAASYRQSVSSHVRDEK